METLIDSASSKTINYAYTSSVIADDEFINTATPPQQRPMLPPPPPTPPISQDSPQPLSNDVSCLLYVITYICVPFRILERICEFSTFFYNDFFPLGLRLLCVFGWNSHQTRIPIHFVWLERMRESHSTCKSPDNIITYRTLIIMHSTKTHTFYYLIVIYFFSLRNNKRLCIARSDLKDLNGTHLKITNCSFWCLATQSK